MGTLVCTVRGCEQSVCSVIVLALDCECDDWRVRHVRFIVDGEKFYPLNLTTSEQLSERSSIIDLFTVEHSMITVHMGESRERFIIEGLPSRHSDRWHMLADYPELAEYLCGKFRAASDLARHELGSVVDPWYDYYTLENAVRVIVMGLAPYYYHLPLTVACEELAIKYPWTQFTQKPEHSSKYTLTGDPVPEAYWRLQC